MLHDIGKTKVPDSILDKPDRLSDKEFEEIKKHPEYGYEIIRSFPEISRTAAQVVLQHHERCDGSGYPYHLKAKEIHLLSKIVAVSDVYSPAIQLTSKPPALV